MLLYLENTPRNYAWGGHNAISDWLGLAATDGAEAELWYGAHTSSPSRVVGLDGAEIGTLDVVIGGNSAALLGPYANGLRNDGSGMPFLLKLLAADAPLSLQAHPSLEQARAGFAAEAALDPSDARRNYSDALHKPELIYALSDPFRALSGFKPASRVREISDALGNDEFSALVDARDGGAEPLYRTVVETLLRDRERGSRLALELATRASDLLDELPGDTNTGNTSGGALSDEAIESLRTAVQLQAEVPGDPGVAISLILNTVVLRPGEALYLDAGNIHAYIKGIGVELMASSDNVLRGGMTPKKIDVDELLKVVRFEGLENPRLGVQQILSVDSAQLSLFAPDVPDFALYVLDGASFATVLDGPAVLFVESGTLTVVNDGETAEVSTERALFISAGSSVEFHGTGRGFLATTNVTPLEWSAAAAATEPATASVSSE